MRARSAPGGRTIDRSQSPTICGPRRRPAYRGTSDEAGSGPTAQEGRERRSAFRRPHARTTDTSRPRRAPSRRPAGRSRAARCRTGQLAARKRRAHRPERQPRAVGGPHILVRTEGPLVVVAPGAGIVAGVGRRTQSEPVTGLKGAGHRRQDQGAGHGSSRGMRPRRTRHTRKSEWCTRRRGRGGRRGNGRPPAKRGAVRRAIGGRLLLAPRPAGRAARRSDSGG